MNSFTDALFMIFNVQRNYLIQLADELFSDCMVLQWNMSYNGSITLCVMIFFIPTNTLCHKCVAILTIWQSCFVLLFLTN
jgi:hypothetical protein